MQSIKNTVFLVLLIFDENLLRSSLGTSPYDELSKIFPKAPMSSENQKGETSGLTQEGSSRIPGNDDDVQIIEDPALFSKRPVENQASKTLSASEILKKEKKLNEIDTKLRKIYGEVNSMTIPSNVKHRMYTDPILIQKRSELMDHAEILTKKYNKLVGKLGRHYQKLIVMYKKYPQEDMVYLVTEGGKIV